jgi:hypothetical protein
MQCKICNSTTTPAFSAKVLGKYDAVYFRCSSCGFMQTEEPHWLAESYASAINEIDLGPVNRAITSSKLIEGLILSTFDQSAKFIDYGAGYGVLVRLMRDRGFDFYWHDVYCQNLFAKQFVAKPTTRFELLTAFEVFEHLVDPLAEIEAMLSYSDNLLFSTLIVPPRAQKASDWWYFAPEHGQHIAFYTRESLETLANTFKLHLCTDGVGMHLLSRKVVSNRLFRFFSRGTLVSQIARQLLRTRMLKKSLLADDFQAVSGHQI